MSSFIDWGNNESIERQVKKQIRMQNPKERHVLGVRGEVVPHEVVRMSDYFGALEIDKINENEAPVERIKCK